MPYVQPNDRFVYASDGTPIVTAPGEGMFTKAASNLFLARMMNISIR